MNGAVFSLDGVHPGKIGHACLAYELLKAMLQVASNRDPQKGTFGKINVSELAKAKQRMEVTDLTEIYKTDIIINLKINPYPFK